MKFISMVSSAALGAALLLLTSGASAQKRFAQSGQFALSAERLFGVVWSSNSNDTTALGGTTTRTTTYTTVTLLANPLTGGTSYYAFPRIAGDYFVIDGLSLGGALGYFHVSGSVKVQSGSVSTESGSGDSNGFVFAPRIGYAFMFGDVVGLWPRAGVTYLLAIVKDDSSTTETNTNRFAISFDLPLVITPVPHAGLTIGPTFDLGVGGADKQTITRGAVQTTTEVSGRATSIGLQAGLFLYF